MGRNQPPLQALITKTLSFACKMVVSQSCLGAMVSFIAMAIPLVSIFKTEETKWLILVDSEISCGRLLMKICISNKKLEVIFLFEIKGWAASASKAFFPYQHYLIRFNGYNLSLLVRHPFISDTKLQLYFNCISFL